MEEHCLRCCHFPVCDVNRRAREARIWEGDLNDFYKKEASGCDFYTPVYCCECSLNKSAQEHKEDKGTT